MRATPARSPHLSIGKHDCHFDNQSSFTGLPPVGWAHDKKGG
jgi:hypothetical protein